VCPISTDRAPTLIGPICWVRAASTPKSTKISFFLNRIEASRTPEAALNKDRWAHIATGTLKIRKYRAVLRT
jgi:hypothetical protein